MQGYNEQKETSIMNIIKGVNSPPILPVAL
jgi:hypothetical protein